METLLIEFLTAAFKISPLLGFLAYSWWSERTERREAQQALNEHKDAILERVLTQQNAFKNTIDSWIELDRRKNG